MFALLFDLEDYATTYRATRDAYLKAANELKLATGPYKVHSSLPVSFVVVALAPALCFMLFSCHANLTSCSPHLDPCFVRPLLAHAKRIWVRARCLDLRYRVFGILWVH
jgi:hypothetical protein